MDGGPDHRLTEDETACLAIAAKGGCIASIGHWEDAIDSLVQLGLLNRLDKFNNVITAEGRAVWVGLEAAEDAEILGALRRAVPDDEP